VAGGESDLNLRPHLPHLAGFGARFCLCEKAKALNVEAGIQNASLSLYLVARTDASFNSVLFCSIHSVHRNMSFTLKEVGEAVGDSGVKKNFSEGATDIQISEFTRGVSGCFNSGRPKRAELRQVSSSCKEFQKRIQKRPLKTDSGT